mmetsp:Transcript_45912/g.109350  ORF Transcript_45912/g.109350 Transcript_45912/m.109350 type:complete len:435 (+) Transcript_45912:100-1404(+)
MGDAAALRFLRHACAVCQDYDELGDTVVRNDAYPRILRDLDIRENSREEDFLRRHLEAAGSGYFSYLPMLRALGVGADVAPPPTQGRSQAEQPPMPETTQQPLQPQSPQQGQKGRGKVPPIVGVGKGAATYADAPPTKEAGYPAPPEPPGRSPAPAASAPPVPPIAPAMAAAAGRPSSGYPDDGVKSSVRADAASEPPEDLEDEEAYWTKRGPAIQSLFQRWDCQVVSNEAFAAQLQEILGSRVDITSPDSDFVKLMNKHRAARNMRFASLTVALRQDARRSAQRRAGYAASAAASEVAPSEAGGFDLANCAAGKPSRTLIDGEPRRRQVVGPDTYARSAGPIDADAWRRSTAQWPPRDEDAASEASFASRSSMVSMADSAREEFIQRGRGHGNILTWGSDSRALTPVQKRRGRGLVTDPSGVARGHQKTHVIA